VGSSGSGSVFVDPTGRRRRVVTAAGIAIGLALAAVVGLLIAGLFGAGPVPLPGLPAGGRGAQEVVVPAAVPTSAEPSGRTTSRPADPAASRPPAGGSVAPAPAAPSASSSPSTRTRGNRPTEHPGNPRTSRSK
jgi:hypothetical protein